MKRIFWILSVVSIFIGHPAAEIPHSLAMTETGIRLISADSSGVDLELSVLSYHFEEAVIDGQRYEALKVPGATYPGKSGEPQLPAFGVLLGVPADVNLRIDTEPGKAIRLDGFHRLTPVPFAKPMGTGDVEGETYIKVDQVAYSADRIYPGELAYITDDAWMRDQRVVRIEASPFQYNPRDGSLWWYPRMQVHVRFDTAGADVKASQFITASSTPFEPILRTNLLNYEQSKAWRIHPQPDSERSRPAVTADQTEIRYRISVEQDGLYALTFDDLQAAGLPVTEIDPRNLQLSNLGTPVAIWVQGEADGMFDTGDRVLFFGEKFDGDRFAQAYPDPLLYWLFDNTGKTYWPGNSYPADVENFQRDEGLHNERYTRENVYWLVVGDIPGLRMQSVNGTPSSAPLIDAYQETLRREESEFRWEFHFTQEDTWLWDYINTSSTLTRTYNAPLSALASGLYTATVRANVIPYTFSPSIYPDHRARISLNDWPEMLQEISWDGINDATFEAQIPQSALIEGENQFHLGIFSVQGVARQQIFFNWFEIAYQRRLEAIQDELLFSIPVTGTKRYQVTGLSGQEALVFDVSNPSSPVRLLNPTISGSGPYAAEFQSDTNSNSRFYLLEETAIRTPLAVSSYQSGDLRSPQGADYIFISHADFITTTQPLADYRAAQGMRTIVVDVQDIYNQFSDGIVHPLAIRNFLSYAYHNWSAPAPGYVLLVGSGNWNFKGDAVARYGAPPIYIPPYMVWGDPWQGEIDSANLLAAFVGEDILPDIAIGRLPVSSADQVTTFLNKLNVFESAPPSEWQQRAAFVADDQDDAGWFAEESSLVADQEIPPYFTVGEYYLDDTPLPDLTNQLTETLNQDGALFVNYTGHGATNRWGVDSSIPANSIFDIDDLEGLNNSTAFPVVVDMTCLTGYWYHPNRVSLASEWVRGSLSGAVSTYSPTGLGVSTGHYMLNSSFYDGIFMGGLSTLGPAANNSKLALFATGFNYDLILTFTIFGDPALRLPTRINYDLALSAVTTQASVNAGGQATYHLEVTNHGALTDTVSLSLQEVDWGSNLSSLALGPLGPGENAQFTVTVDVPADAVFPDSDEIRVIASSNGNPSLSAAVSLLTRVKAEYEPQLSADQTELSGRPGENVTYALQITNNGMLVDTFSIEMTQTDWVTEISQTSFGPLEPDESQSFSVTVRVPGNAGPLEFEHVSITATSNGDSEMMAEIGLITGVSMDDWLIYLPSVLR